MTHPLFGPEVRFMLEDEDTEGMREFCESLHPATVAESLSDMSVEQAWHVLSVAPIAEQATIFPYFSLDWQVEMAEGAGRPHMARLIEQMSHDDRATLLRELDPRVTESILRLVDEADRRDIAQSLTYEEDSVGALMTTDYAWVPNTLTAAVAIDRLRQQAAGRETIYYIYVLDERTRRLAGVVSLKDLILAPRSRPVTDLMETNIQALKVTDDRGLAADLTQEYDFLAIPVVDDENRLVGIVTHDDVLDVVEEEATEDLQRQAAVGPIGENYLDAGYVKVWARRAFWLALMFIGELLTSLAMVSFEETLEELLVLAMFVPLCISVGGNSGAQASSLITRSMALGEVTPAGWFRVFKHEIVIGMALGMTLAIIGYARGLATWEDVRSNQKAYEKAVVVRLPTGSPPPQTDDMGRLLMPDGAIMDSQLKDHSKILLPEGVTLEQCATGEPGVYTFPKGATFSEPPVSRWSLGWVVAIAVFSICLWGTLLGSMLPLLMKVIGWDPAIASGPIVATLVDVTGIIIYFTVAKLILLNNHH